MYTSKKRILYFDFLRESLPDYLPKTFLFKVTAAMHIFPFFPIAFLFAKRILKNPAL